MPTVEPRFSSLREVALSSGELTLLPWSRITKIKQLREDVRATSTDAHMIAHTHVPHPFTDAHLDKFLGPPADHIARWAIVIEARYCGNVELRANDANPYTGELGYSTAPWARGRGVMTNAVALLTECALDHGLHRLEIKAAPSNPASCRVAQRCGYTCEGILRDAQYLRGAFNDLAVYSRLATDSS